jgi:hypothetical protein
MMKVAASNRWPQKSQEETVYTMRPRYTSAVSSAVEMAIQPRNVRATGHTSAWNPSTRSAVSRCAGSTRK